MGKWICRVLLAAWFVGMVSVAVWNGQRAEAQGAGNHRLFLPLLQKSDLVAQAYVGLVRIRDEANHSDYYTIRGDGSGWTLLVNGTDDYVPSALAWSPNGAYVVFTNYRVTRNETWLVSVATREALQIAPIRAEKFVWSPDSRYIAFTKTDSMYVFDMQTNEVVGVWSTLAYDVFWSPDSQVLGWVSDPSPTDDTEALWLWQMSQVQPTQVFTGNLAMDGEIGTATDYFWSPDSRQLFFNALTYPHAVYKTTSAGEPATRLLEESVMYGWVEGGNRILVAQDAWYFATPDGSEFTFFREYDVSGYGMAVSIAPTGEKALFGSWYDPHPTVIQATDSLTATRIAGCRGYTFQWQSDSTRFACDSDDVLRGDFATKVGDATTDSPTIEVLGGHQNPQFIPNSATFLATNKYQASYPSPFEGSFLYNMETKELKRIRYPHNDQYPVLEWRYMP
jgi:hypothetical protein